MEQVQKRRCKQCLFSKNKIVSDARKKQILEDCETNNNHFVCHKSSIKNDGSVMCRGFYDEKTNPVLNAVLIDANYIKFVDVE